MNADEFQALKSKANEYDPDALFEMGKAYLDPPFSEIEKDLDEALWYFRASVWEAEKLGKVYGASAYWAGYLLYLGTGSQIDTMAAYHYWLYATSAGNASAYYRLGCYHIGREPMTKGCGYDRIPSMGIKYLFEAANRNNGAAAFELSLCYYNGNGVVSSKTEALEWALKSAELGDVSGMHNAGVMSEEFYDYDTAGHWFYEAAQRGDKEAQEALQHYQYSKLTKKWRKRN